MVYMFNELSLTQVDSKDSARLILETFVKSTIKAKELGFSEIRLYEKSLQNLYHLRLIDGYRIDNWLVDSEINSDLQDSFREIITSAPLLSHEDIFNKELYERSEFYLTFDNNVHQAYGFGAAFIYSTLAISLATHHEWLKPSIFIQNYSISLENIECTDTVKVLHFSSAKMFETHKQWIEDEQKKSIRKSIDLWIRREEYFPNILFGVDIETHLNKIELSRKVDQVFSCLKKLDDYAITWREGGFSLNDLRSQSLMDISGESDSTMNKYSVERKFRLSNGFKEQFEFHIKIPDLRIYFLPDEKTHKITVGYIGKHLRTALFN